MLVFIPTQLALITNHIILDTQIYPEHFPIATYILARVVNLG